MHKWNKNDANQKIERKKGKCTNSMTTRKTANTQERCTVASGQQEKVVINNSRIDLYSESIVSLVFNWTLDGSLLQFLVTHKHVTRINVYGDATTQNRCRWCKCFAHISVYHWLTVHHLNGTINVLRCLSKFKSQKSNKC